MTSKIFLLDAMALIYKAHFGMVKNSMSNSKGLPTGAIYAFTNMLLGILKKYEPTHVAAAFDSSKPTFRHDICKEYKSHRPPQPAEITVAIPYIKKIIDALGISSVMLEGYEADDIIGTLTRRSASLVETVYIVSPDKDFDQLLTSDRIYIYKPATTAKQEMQLISQKNVLERWGIDNVGQVCDILGLQGDVSDNIPGVAGIGRKISSSLIKDFGSVDSLLNNLDKLKRKFIRDNLERYKEQAVLSKKLATIDTDVPIEYTLESLKYKGYDEVKIKELFTELEFLSLMKKFFPENGNKTHNPSAQPSLFSEENTID